MTIKQIKVELLAPAKNIECGISAINCGADAVYIGASNFGARASAVNDLHDIKKLINYAHKFNAKVYVTINTILTDDELLEAAELINDLYKIKADAIIIQDMGILELDLPSIEIHASTQCHNVDIDKIKFFEKIGLKRVILPRELSLSEIAEIRKNTNIELESFIHGSLCVSYSGQCYLSHFIGGRSGNRGQCAQPCRKKYSLKTSSGKIIAKNKHLLSLKDFNLSENINDLLQAGITSFKIEGRLKDENYIKNIVSFYRQKIDNSILNTNFVKASSGKNYIDFATNPYKTFNRGYTTYFINGRQKNIESIDTPKSTGEPIGKIKIVDKSFFTIKSDKKLNNGDGICFFDNEQNLKGTLISKTVEDKIYPASMDGISANTFIYRNSDLLFAKMLKNTSIQRKISVNIEITSDEENIVFKLTDEDKNIVEESIKNNFDYANNPKNTIETYKKQLSKLGESEFVANDIILNGSKVYFIPIKILNEIRRNLVTNLINLRLKKYQPNISKIIKNNYAYPEKELNYKANIYNSKAEEFYNRHQSKVIEYAIEKTQDFANKELMETKYCLKYVFNMCSKNTKNNESLYLIDEKGKTFKLEFDCSNCKMKILNKS
ncbi:MAG: U32 family peptidase [Candidatus Gastranaerophilales bacterium]|nr:U32 family peptidase [Candidatus Gastranaerophilales bacterium]